MSPGIALAAAAIYVLSCRVLLRLSAQRRDPLFALCNLVAVFYFFFWHGESYHPLLYSVASVAYVGLVSLQYFALRSWASAPGRLPWLAFFAPIASLIAIRYMPLVRIVGAISKPTGELLQRHQEITLNRIFVGISYLAFRTSYLVLEVRNREVPRPNLWQYLGFAFFAPTLSVGPINRYSEHERAFRSSERPAIPVGRALLRVLVGGVKYQVLGPILNQFTYSGLILDGHPHHLAELPIAAIAYYSYMYCNFSGFCDMAIGGAGLIGISVAENFADPFGARNVTDFWNRWHITLSEYMRTVVFSPVSKALVRAFGASHVDAAIAATILLVFVLIGIWHGTGWHFAAFGVSQALAVIANRYYSLFLKRRLGKHGFAAYNRSRFIHVVAVMITFLFTSACLFLFANDWAQMKAIFSSV